MQEQEQGIEYYKRMVDFSHELVGADSIAELGELAVRQAVAVRGRDAPHCF